MSLNKQSVDSTLYKTSEDHCICAESMNPTVLSCNCIAHLKNKDFKTFPDRKNESTPMPGAEDLLHEAAERSFAAGRMVTVQEVVAGYKRRKCTVVKNTPYFVKLVPNFS